MATKLNGHQNEKFLTLDNLSPAVKNVQYAVRGKIVIRAGELEKELKQVWYFNKLHLFLWINIFLFL